MYKSVKCNYLPLYSDDIAMNNEEQDVKNILVLQNRQETRRKEMKLNSLLHNTLCKYFNFPIFDNVLLKNI